MSTVWGALLSSFIRWLLAMIIGRLLLSGIIDEALASRVLGEGVAEITLAVIGLLALGWGFRVKLVDYLRLRIAARLPKGTSPEEAVDIAKVPLLSPTLLPASNIEPLIASK